MTAGDVDLPASAEDLVRDFLRGVKITPEDFRKETGLSISEQKKFGLMVKCTPERGHNALFFIPLQVFIML